MKLRELKLLYSDNLLRTLAISINGGFHEGKTCHFQDWRGTNAIVKMDVSIESNTLLPGDTEVILDNSRI